MVAQDLLYRLATLVFLRTGDNKKRFTGVKRLSTILAELK